MKEYRIGIIDLGSNTARLVVMTAVPGYAYRLEDEIREVVRLREGMGPAGLSQAAIQRALSTLRLFKRFCDRTGVDIIIPTATSAVRDAANGAAFIERVDLEIGLSLRLLSGEQEAYYAAIGALNERPLNDGYVLDIGGGSMQLSRVQDNRFEKGASRPLGSLALTIQFLQQDPPPESAVETAVAEIERQLDTISWLEETGQLVGLGGTIRNLAKIEAARQDHPLYTLHGFTLTRASVQQSIALFRQQPLAQRQRIQGLSSDRADIILGGALVLECVMVRLGMDAMTLSLSGLREGVFLERFWRHLPYPVIPDVRHFSVLSLARIYNYQKHHANHVRFLSRRLFEQLAPLHGYGRSQRELLDAAALLHDIGTVIAYDRHHKHSQTLIEYNGLAGYTPREIALIALLARYHRKGKPSVTPYRSILDKRSDKRLLRVLSAILRLAEFIERGRDATVDDVIVTWTDEVLRLTLVAEEYPAVELWETERQAVPLVEKVFGRRVQLESLIAPGDWPARTTTS